MWKYASWRYMLQAHLLACTALIIDRKVSILKCGTMFVCLLQATRKGRKQNLVSIGSGILSTEYFTNRSSRASCKAWICMVLHVRGNTSGSIVNGGGSTNANQSPSLTMLALKKVWTYVLQSGQKMSWATSHWYMQKRSVGYFGSVTVYI